MNILSKSNPKTWLHHQGNNFLSRVSRAFSFSTGTLLENSLKQRISRAGNPKVSIIPVIEQWIGEGRDIKRTELRTLIKQLRGYRRYNHALQISQWMSDQSRYAQLPGDLAIQLDLISKVHGLEQAEKYYNSIPDNLRGIPVDGALLNCYAYEKHLEKAETMMQKLKELGSFKVLSYNVMLTLYSQMREYEKLDALVEEMEQKGIAGDTYTFNIRLNAYAATSNIEEMEKLLTKMEVDPLINLNCHSCFAVANGYLKAGLTDRALAMLKRAEPFIIPLGSNSKRHAYEILITFYAAAGNKDGMYRVWGLCKKMGRIFNTTYLCMMNSLIKLDNIDEIDWIWEEWVSQTKVYDARIPNTIIRAYSKKGLWEKAEAVLNKIIESGRQVEASSWDLLAMGYHYGGQMTNAIETIKKAVSVSKPGWKPNVYTLASCLEYLESHGDGEAAEEFSKFVGERCHFQPGMHGELNNSVSRRNLFAGALDEMKCDDQTLNGEPLAFMDIKTMDG